MIASLPLPVPDLTQISIVICDGHAIFRDGLRRLLLTAPAFQVIGQTSDPATLVAMVRDLRPDVVLLSVTDVWAVSRAALEEIARLETPVRTIVLSGSMDSERINDALHLGAAGVVPKDAPADVLFDSIESVMAGQVCVGRDRVSDLAAAVRRFDVARRQAKAFGLTSRELEIVEAIMAGDTNKAIALRFSISENTVKRHLMHIYDKVGASNRVELAVFAAYHQLISSV